MENYIVLISFTYPHEAHLVKGMLESNQIFSIIKDEYTVQVNNLYSNAIGGVKLLVAESDYDRSINLLKEAGYILENNDKAEKIELVKVSPNIDVKQCPFCKSENINRNKRSNFFTIILSLAFLQHIPLFSYTHKCFDCYKEWKFIK